MKEILDNWKQYINEQETTTPEQRLDAVVRAVYDLDRASDDKRWSTIKKRTSNYNLKKISDAIRNKIYYTFDSSIGEKSFVRMVRQTKEVPVSVELRIDPKASDEQILKQYREVYLPKIKKIVDTTPIVNLASKTAAQLYPAGVEYIAKRLQKGQMVGGFFANNTLPGLPPFIGINPYAYIDDRGMVSYSGVQKALLEELAHAVDLLLGVRISDLLGGLEDITKRQKDTDIKLKDYYDYLRDPVETYAKLKVIKSELMGIDRRAFFDEQGRIDLDRLKNYLEDPESKKRHPILRILNIQKLEDIGKVLDQIARVDQQKTSQMA
jgi:hypothetical protein